MSECVKHRKSLDTWEAFERLIDVIWLGSGGLPCDKDGKYKNDVLHVQTCESCKAWIEEKVPTEIKKRTERLKKYCCPVMFGAVEESRDGELNLKLMNFQGDPVWAVRNFDHLGSNLLFSYCPWCGSKLPNKPFIET
ncbi:MAG: hypothetical protein KBT87_11320 [Gammaproteobacteria bacterium]|jgi:hypothetical protein|nr:hypothetical protein [Gammaproteobacteria bacterium]MBQ0775253.1 hypothetical protein [Gammaproteobacteria bacterium]